MRTVVPPHRPVVFKTSRDTLVLLAAASGVAVAIAYSVHSHPAPDTAQQTTEQAAAGEWTGQLAALAPSDASAPAPMSSDALTVPKAAMALPAPPVPAAGAVKIPRGCDSVPCPPPAKTTAPSIAAAPMGAPAPAHRPAPASRPHIVREANLLDRLNPLNHIPEMVKRPFASAGDTIAGWVKRF